MIDMILDQSALEFPVLIFFNDLVRFKESWEVLTKTTTAGLKNGIYRNALLVDGRGRAVKIHNAAKLCGIGLFWGFNIFLNQHIRVKLLMDGPVFSIPFSEVRDKVLLSFRKWPGWSSRGDFEELVEAVKNAKTIPEIIELLCPPARRKLAD